MKKCFEKISDEAKVKNLQRFPTSIDGVQTLDDVRVVLKEVLGDIDELSARIEALEKK